MDAQNLHKINIAPDWPSARRGWYAVFVITLSLLINFLDRGIIALLVPNIKADLQLSDTQLSLIMGFAFVMFYMFAGLPIARYADHGNRKKLIAVGLALWGGATALCGLAKSFNTLFAFRVGVGVGEACTGPASYSLLGDYFPPEKLPRAIAFLNFGFIAGNGLALLIGGTVVGILAANASAFSFPIIGELRVWQLAFIVVGIPGLLVSLLMLTVREPVRRVAGKAPSIKEVGDFLMNKRWVYVPLIIGISLNTIVAVGHASWGPAFFMRTYGWSVATVGLVSGLTFILLMPVGAMLGSMMAERWTREGRADANMRVVIFALIVSLPFMIAAPLMPVGWMAAGLNAIGMFFTAFLFGPQNAAIQLATPNRMRGQISALVLFGFNVIGYGFGPTVLALITNYVFRDEMQIGYAMATSYAIISPIALVILWLAVKPYAETIREIQDKEKTA
ncbi:MFS transporter [Emcibacter sp.]|uniref:spinster family MFS transporter n=1 Tax=Emcibacter sp. TaxID=1979954 RepID=UPI002AA7C154|nr:MFS transporter [Emcibacter sp.]